MKLLFATILSIALMSVLYKPASAQTVVFSEDFDTDLSKWEEVRNKQWRNDTKKCLTNGQLSEWKIKNQQLEIEIDGPPCTMELVAKDLDVSSYDAYTMEFDWQFLESTVMDRNAVFSWQDENNWYGIKIFDNELVLQKVVGGSAFFLDPFIASFPFEINTWYHISISVDSINHLITISVDDAVVLETTDTPPFLSTGPTTIALQAGVGSAPRTHALIDNIVVSTDDVLISLPINSLKQTDSRWSQELYDSAEVWAAEYNSGITIADWGCNLTVQTMLMNYFGISNLPSGEELTPLSLNDWLKSHDGYYQNSGLIKQTSVSRLSAEVSESLGSPKLEYAYSAEDNVGVAQSEIQSGRPVIIELSGHFVLGYGLTTSGDILIHDPSFPITHLSKHHLELRSVRSFYPTHSDLSSLTFSSSQPFEIVMKDTADQQIKLTTYEEFLSSQPENGTSYISPRIYVAEVLKPETEKYELEISSQNSGIIFIETTDKSGALSSLGSLTTIKNQAQKLEIKVDEEKSIKRIKPNKITAKIYHDKKKTKEFKEIPHGLMIVKTKLSEKIHKFEERFEERFEQRHIDKLSNLRKVLSRLRKIVHSRYNNDL